MHTNLNSMNDNSKLVHLPPLNEEEQKHSECLTVMIKDIINKNGDIPFVEFMRLALYQPEYGYYLAGQRKFGKQGDFITAPEVSELFSYALAVQCAQILGEIKDAGILEFGAGSGRMACDILHYLEKIQCLPAYYQIVEVSAELKQRQYKYLQARVPHLLSRIAWVSDVEECRVDGVILANEILDAMPVHRFIIKDGQVYEYYVGIKGDKLIDTLRPATCKLRKKVMSIEQSLGFELPEGYSSEVNLAVKPWLSLLKHTLCQGVIICIDYGYPRKEYYMSERKDGTLMCHYKHRAHDKVLINIGIQDITAHVDFTDVVESASAVGLEFEGFTSQAHFLSACNIDHLFQVMREENPGNDLRLAQEIKTLMLPGEMGERFKVMGLSRNYKKPLCGFAQIDYSNRL